MSLIEETDLSDIGVAALTELAGTSRSTFYDHFHDVQELAESACTALIDELIESLSASGRPLVDGGGPEVLVAYFANFSAHARLYRNVLGPQGSARVADRIRRRIAVAVRLGAGTPTGRGTGTGEGPGGFDLYAAFTASALLGVAVDWVQGGCVGTSEDLAAGTWILLSAHGGVSRDPTLKDFARP